jgi:hypothetical protein
MTPQAALAQIELHLSLLLMSPKRDDNAWKAIRWVLLDLREHFLEEALDDIPPTLLS